MFNQYQIIIFNSLDIVTHSEVFPARIEFVHCFLLCCNVFFNVKFLQNDFIDSFFRYNSLFFSL